MKNEKPDTDVLMWPEFDTLDNGDLTMVAHHPDSDMPTPPPGGSPLSSGDQEWKRGVWNALRDMKKSVDSQTTQITQLLIATKGTVNELDLNKTAQAVRDLMYKELKDRDDEHARELRARDVKIQALHDFKVRITTAIVILNAVIGIALTVIALYKK